MNNPFKRRRYTSEVILLCVRWYLRYALSYRNLAEILEERGLTVEPSTILRWVNKYAPILEEKCRNHLKKHNGSYRVDETYIKVKSKWKYLYRAVDKQNQTIEFYFSSRRDKAAAKKFFKKALGYPHSVAPYVINVDKNPAYPSAIAELKAFGDLPNDCKLRQVKYLNNGIESDHRFVKRQCRHKQWFRSFSSARTTIAGYEAMHMIKKGQIRRIAKGNIVAQNAFIASLFQAVA